MWLLLACALAIARRAEAAFSERIIDAADSFECIKAVDLDGDGDVDLVASSINLDTVAWFENDGSEAFTEHIITTLAASARAVFAIDVDGDGDEDVLSASNDDDTIAWYLNVPSTGAGSISFVEYLISTLADEARSVFAIDVVDASTGLFDNAPTANPTTSFVPTAGPSVEPSSSVPSMVPSTGSPTASARRGASSRTTSARRRCTRPLGAPSLGGTSSRGTLRPWTSS